MTSLYIHIPWCIRKCPYCDFNSHKSPDNLPEESYINQLINDFKHDLSFFTPRTIKSIFIGGGTPSLLSAEIYERLFSQLKQLVTFDDAIEITLEANPGTVEQTRFKAYRQLGINRLSLGIQSFNPKHLKILGRIHDDKQAHQAIMVARNAGFDNINLDIMHSLPEQTVAEGINDLTQALSYSPEHISWYQLTLEPNTVFYKQRPSLPHETIIDELEKNGLILLSEKGLTRYEISAFCQPNYESKHNLNYWLYGDYYGIGAGAHGKVTQEGSIFRTRKRRQPNDYLNPQTNKLGIKEIISSADILFEFMLNTTRLQQCIPYHLFSERTGLPLTKLMPKLEEAQAQNLILLNKLGWQITEFGRRYTNNLQELFLPEDS